MKARHAEGHNLDELEGVEHKISIRPGRRRQAPVSQKAETVLAASSDGYTWPLFKVKDSPQSPAHKMTLLGSATSPTSQISKSDRHRN